ncbi:hypothetical protein SDJN03_28471, partial [Cucurbita argyrosperma subsp. sororia]
MLHISPLSIVSTVTQFRTLSTFLRPRFPPRIYKYQNKRPFDLTVFFLSSRSAFASFLLCIVLNLKT